MSFIKLGKKYTDLRALNGWIDPAFYRSNYGSNIKFPSLHYHTKGWKRGFNPNYFFDTNWYLENNDDVKAQNQNPLKHYYYSGRYEHRDPHPVFTYAIGTALFSEADLADGNLLNSFLSYKEHILILRHVLIDSSYYATKYGINEEQAFHHFMTEGFKTGHNPNPYFDVNWYLSTNSDLQSEVDNAMLHYTSHGWKEGRNPHPDFSSEDYLLLFPELRAGNSSPLEHFLRHRINKRHTDHIGFCQQVGFSYELKTFDFNYYAHHYNLAHTEALQHFFRIGWHLGNNPNEYIDINWYKETYPDVAQGGLNPLIHYVQHGWREGRNPSPRLNTKEHLKRHPDLIELNINPIQHLLETKNVQSDSYQYLTSTLHEEKLIFDTSYYAKQYNIDQNGLQHYLSKGWQLGYNPCEYFDTNWYLEANPDVKSLGMNPLSHYCYAGWKEYRSPHPEINPIKYVELFPELKEHKIPLLRHYIKIGQHDMLDYTKLVDAVFYKHTYGQDIDDPNLHYMDEGWRLGYNPVQFFDTKWYLEHNVDIQQEGINPYLHFCKYGWKEGRNPHPEFDIDYYQDTYADVTDLGLNPLLHYTFHGKYEARKINKDQKSANIHSNYSEWVSRYDTITDAKTLKYKRDIVTVSYTHLTLPTILLV